MPDVRVAPLARADLPAVVAIHKKAFPDSAITAFGDEAIRRYYLWLLEGPHDAALTGAWTGGTLAGFCAAGVFRGAMNGFLRENRRYLALRIATHPRLWLSPLVRDRLKTALQITLRFSRLRPAPANAPAPSFGVLSIATDPDIRAGAGRALMHEAEARARTRGHASMVLTVHPENSHAIAFYERLAWVRQPDADGAWRGAMTKRLS
jgi:ribosomal protein S18 acetylase RimI-like enzyme